MQGPRCATLSDEWLEPQMFVEQMSVDKNTLDIYIIYIHTINVYTYTYTHYIYIHIYML